MNRIMQIFYGTDFLPYKDKERVVHYPIVGNSFNGMSNVDQIRFYVKDIGGTLTLSWVAITKLPNGRIIYELLNTIGYDSECNEYYVSLSISNLYTQLKGDVYISLNGYKGEVEIETDQETGLQTITATLDSPTVVATGSIKLSINYAPQRPQGFSFGIDQFQYILNALGNKANTINTIQVVENINSLNASDYEIGQLFYCLNNEKYYEIIYDAQLESNAFKHKLLDSVDLINRYVVNSNDSVHAFYNGLVASGQISSGITFLLNVNGSGEYIAQFNPYSQATINEKLTLFNIGTQKLYSKSIVDSLITFANVLESTNEYEYVRKIKQGGIVYGTLPTDQSGSVFGFPYSANATPNNIVQRNNDGQIVVPLTPTSDNHATPKKYVDDLFASFKENELQVVDTSEYPTLHDFLDEYLGEEGVIYLYPIDTSDLTKGYYRYIWENNDWLSLGTTEIDLSDYYTKEQVDDIADDINNNIPKHQTTTILIVDPLTNINGRAFVNYTSENVTIGGFPAVKILRGGDALNEQYAKEYMEYMCGSYYLPKYNYDKPKNTYFIMPNGQLLKPQYDSTNGLVLYYNGQIATKDYADGFAKSLLVTINSSTYVMTLTLKDANGNTLGTPQTVDLPLETMVVGGSYDDTTKSLILTLKNGNTITIPVGDLVDGLVSESQLQAFTLEIQNALSEKANIIDLENGTLVPEKAIQAKSIQAVSVESGAIQETPFIYQGTGTANGADIVDTSPVGKHLEKQGNTIVANQKFDKSKILASGSGTGYSWVKNADNTITITVTETIQQDTNILLTRNIGSDYAKVPTGHRFFYTTNNSNPNICFRDSFSGYDYPSGTGTAVNGNNTENILVSVRLKAGLTAGTYKVDIDIVDLTQMFNGDIPQDLLDNPSNFFRYYNGSLASNTGTLSTSNGQYLVCGGRNIYDGTTSATNKYLDVSGAEQSASGYNITNFIRVNPNTDYYFYATPGTVACVCFYDKDKNFISATRHDYLNSTHIAKTPSNCFYIKDSIQTRQCISLYYTTGDGYDKYYPYEQPKVYDTGNETLLSAPKVYRSATNSYEYVKDYKEPNGTIYRFFGEQHTLNAGSVVLINLSYSNIVYYGFTKPNDMKGNSSYTQIAIGNNKGFKPYKTNIWDSADNINCYTTTADATSVWFGFPAGTTLEQARAVLGGMVYYYEIATPTTEQGTSFSDLIEINDYGTMAWKDSNNEYVEVPQGCKIFYPADYVLFLDSLGQRADVKWDATKLVSQSQLQQALASFLPSIAGYDATKNQTLKNVEGTFTWVDD